MISIIPIFTGTVTYAHATQNFRTWEKREAIFEINTFPNNGIPTVIYYDNLSNENTALGKNVMLKVAIVTGTTVRSMPHLLNRGKMKCSGGTLCWAYIEKWIFRNKARANMLYRNDNRLPLVFEERFTCGF